MAQTGPHGHQVSASDDGHSAPPTPVAFSQLTSAAGSYGTGGSSAGNMETVDASAGMGKNLIPDLNMEERVSAGGSKDKPLSEAEVEVADDDDKGKGVAATADDGEPSDNINVERERRKRMKGLFRTLQDLMPHVAAQKTDKVTVVEEAIQYIKFLEEKAAILEKQKLKKELARQAAAASGEASSSSSLALTAAGMPQTAQGMAALSSSGVPRAGWAGGGVPVPPAAAAPAVPAVPPVRFKTWSGRNFVLTVANDNAYISVWLPRRPNTLTMVMSVLHNHRIDVITAQISADRVRTLFMIYAHVNGTNGENRSSVEVYQRAVSEIIYRLVHGISNN